MDSVDISELPKLKVAELKKLLKDRNLSLTGNKGELVKRLEDAMADGGLNENEALKEDDLLDDPEADNLLEDSGEQTGVAAQVELGGKGEPAEEPATEKSEETQKSAPQKILFESKETSDGEQKAAARAERFGLKSEDDQKSKRAARFGIVSEDEKKAARAAKFGLTDENKKPSAATSPVDSEKLAKRQARFGLVEVPAAKSAKTNSVNSPALAEEEKEKILKRKERFREVANEGLNGADKEKINKRKERFGAISATVVSAEDEAKRKKRAERFAAA